MRQSQLEFMSTPLLFIGLAFSIAGRRNKDDETRVRIDGEGERQKYY